MHDLDPMTLQVYEFIFHYLREKKLSPALREIGEACYLGTSSVTTHLARLEGKGWIERDFNKPRSIRLGDFAPNPPPASGLAQDDDPPTR